MNLLNSFCSLTLVERRVNDRVRRSAAASAATTLPESETNFIKGESPSKKVFGPRYSIMGPDPLENPNRVYVDVSVFTFAIPVEPKLADFVRYLRKNIGLWKTKFVDEEAPKFYTKEIAAPVHLSICNPNHFSRRLTLKNLSKLIMEVLIPSIVKKESFFNCLFETPSAVANNPSLAGIANRSRFRQETLVDWFFEFDTYSKCILMVEFFCWYLRSNGKYIQIQIDDIYCDIFSEITRPTFITFSEKPSQAAFAALSPTIDTRLLKVDHCVSNFLFPFIHDMKEKQTVREESRSCQYYWICRPTTATLPVNERALLPTEILKQQINSFERRNITEDAEEETSVQEAPKNIVCDIDDNDFLIRKRLSGNAIDEPKKKKLKEWVEQDYARKEEITPIRILEGYNDGALCPIVIYKRRYPIVPKIHAQITFPVFDCALTTSKPSQNQSNKNNILFFMKLREEIKASLFLAGLFDSPEQFFSGECNQHITRPTSIMVNDIYQKTTNNNTTITTTINTLQQNDCVWRYSLADYCPIRMSQTILSTQPITLFSQPSPPYLTNTLKKQINVQPLSF